MQIPVRLQPHPQLRRGVQQSSQSERGIRRDSALPEDNLVQAVERDVQALCGLDLAQAHRLQILLEQDLSGGNRRPQPGRIPYDGTYFTLTPRILDLGFTYLATVDVANIAQPSMERIVHTLRESCSIAVLDGPDAVYVARVAAKRIMSINLVVGSRLPAHATSMGKVLLAHLAPAKLDEYFAAGPLRQLTDRTIVDETALRKALDQVRTRGWAFADQESEDGVRTVAVPLFDRNMQVQAAMNVSGHASRVPMKELRGRYLRVLMEAAASISHALGANIAAPPVLPRR